MEGDAQVQNDVQDQAPDGGQEQVADPGQEQDAGAEERQQQTQDWATAPLPAGHPYAAKYKTHGDLLKAYEASSNEGRRLYALARDYEARLKAPAKPAAPVKEDDFWGFGSKETYLTSLQNDLEGTQNKVIERVVSKILQEKMGEVTGRIQPLEEQLRAERGRVQYAGLVQRYPDAAAGGAGDQAASQYVEQNRDVVQALSGLGNVDLYDIAYKLGNFDLLAAKLKDAEAKLNGHSRRAQTARPGTSAQKQTKETQSPEDAINAALEDVRASGEQVDERTVEAARNAARKHLNWRT